MIRRTRHLRALTELLRIFPVGAILGVRQTGKTTLARQFAAATGRPVSYFDLENPLHAQQLADPMGTLDPLRGLVILDEIQLAPELFSVLRPLADRERHPARFLILGSASPRLMKRASESLAGRIGRHVLSGLAPDEAGEANSSRLWLRGGLPPSFLAASDEVSLTWRNALIETYLDRDVPALGIATPPHTLRRFWKMLAHVHGQLWNATDFSRSFGMSEFMVRRYLDILSGLYLIRVLQPWHENISKRQVKAPRVFFTDTGLLHAVLDIRDAAGLAIHPRMGASWEGFAMSRIMEMPAIRNSEWYFWRTHLGAELDLMAVRGRSRIGFEIKANDSPGMTPSMRSALADLKLDRLIVVHAGKETYSLGDRVTACPLNAIPL